MLGFWEQRNGKESPVKAVVKQMFSDKYRQHLGFSGLQLLTLFSVPLFTKPHTGDAASPEGSNRFVSH
jgi:hypothetical protein